MVWKLGDLCLLCIQENLGSYPNLGSSLPNIYKEILIERLACHDKFFPRHMSHISNSLFSKSLRHINLNRCDQVTDSVLKLLGISGCKLESLKMLALNEVTDLGVRAIVEGQDQLHVLHIKHLPLVSDKVLQYVRSPKLWSFKMTHPAKNVKLPWLSDAALAPFCEHNNAIKELKISGGAESIAVIAKRLNSSLEELNLNYHAATDQDIEILAQYCTNLRKLDLNGARYIGRESVITLFQACTQMEELDFGYCTKLATPQERDVFWALPQSLKVLSLMGLNLDDENIFVESITRLPHVHTLKLCGVPALNDSTMEKIMEKIGANIVELNVGGVMTTDFTDEALKSVTKYCTRLESLHISLLKNVTGTSLVPLFQDPKRAARIRSLSINSRMMEASVIDQVVSSCPNIEFLNVSGLTIVTDAMIITLADHSPKLYHVCLKGCKKLTDKSICYLSARCPLNVLVLSGIHALTDKSIFCLASSCPQLVDIYLDACAQVSPVAVTYLQDQCLQRLKTKHATPNASPDQIMGKNIDTGEYCRLDLM